METPNDLRGGGPDPAPQFLGEGARGLLRWVCTNNPFYVLSAWLVCLGLWVSFGAQANLAQTWALSGGLIGYTVLLAGTACILVRRLGAWDDVRTVMLLVVLMLLAFSVTFDVVIARDPRLGATCSLGGLAIAAVISEGVLRGTRLGMPSGFRLPYYLFLGLFFLYPPALAPLLDRPRGEGLAWALFGFGAAGGLVTLTLIPAVRLGAEYVRGNGSPWRWPLYPWTLFALIGLATGVRAPLLCHSMLFLSPPDHQLSIFGPYFLIPLLLAVGVLLLEAGLAGENRALQRLALILPIGLVILAAIGHRPDRIYQGFLGIVEARLGGTPLYLTVLASAAFALYGMARRVRGAIELLSAAIATLAVIGPQTLDFRGLTPLHPLPFLGVAALQIALGLRRGQSWRCLLGMGALVASALLVMDRLDWGLEPYRGPIAFSLGLLAILGVGAAFDDPLGRWLRDFGAMLGAIASLAATTGRFGWDESLPWWTAGALPLALATLFLGYGLWLRRRSAFVAAGLSMAGGAGSASRWGYSALREWAVGLDYIALGLIFFALAALISAIKAGALSPWLALLRKKLPPPTW